MDELNNNNNTNKKEKDRRAWGGGAQAINLAIGCYIELGCPVGRRGSGYVKKKRKEDKREKKTYVVQILAMLFDPRMLDSNPSAAVPHARIVREQKHRTALDRMISLLHM